MKKQMHKEGFWWSYFFYPKLSYFCMKVKVKGKYYELSSLYLSSQDVCFVIVKCEVSSVIPPKRSQWNACLFPFYLTGGIKYFFNDGLVLLQLLLKSK